MVRLLVALPPRGLSFSVTDVGKTGGSGGTAMGMAAAQWDELTMVWSLVLTHSEVTLSGGLNHWV